MHGKKESLAVPEPRSMIQQHVLADKKRILDCGSMNTARRSMEVIISLYSGPIRPHPAAAARFRHLSTRH